MLAAIMVLLTVAKEIEAAHPDLATALRDRLMELIRPHVHDQNIEREKMIGIQSGIAAAVSSAMTTARMREQHRKDI